MISRRFFSSFSIIFNAHDAKENHDRHEYCRKMIEKIKRVFQTKLCINIKIYQINYQRQQLLTSHLLLLFIRIYLHKDFFSLILLYDSNRVDK